MFGSYFSVANPVVHRARVTCGRVLGQFRGADSSPTRTALPSRDREGAAVTGPAGSGFNGTDLPSPDILTFNGAPMARYGPHKTMKVPAVGGIVVPSRDRKGAAVAGSRKLTFNRAVLPQPTTLICNAAQEVAD